LEGLKLLRAARKAGLAIVRDGSDLVLRGSRDLATLAASLLANKEAVLAALEDEATAFEFDSGPVPISAEDFAIKTVEDMPAPEGGEYTLGPCWVCTGTCWWRLGDDRPWVCASCHPTDREDVEEREVGP
jgi:hypothetical protein